MTLFCLPSDSPQRPRRGAVFVYFSRTKRDFCIKSAGIIQRGLYNNDVEFVKILAVKYCYVEVFSYLCTQNRILNR